MKSELIYRGGKGYTLYQAVIILKKEKMMRRELR